MHASPRHRPLFLFRDRRGVVTLELALIMPIMVLMLLGFYESYMYVRSVAMVERAAATIANVMGRQSQQLRDCANSSDALNLGTYVDAAVRLIYPMPLDTKGEVLLSAVSSVNGTPTVRWQRRSNFELSGVKSAVGKNGGTATLPAALQTVVAADTNITVMVVEVNYRFTPFATFANWANNPGEVTISRAAYFRTRILDHNTLISATSAGCSALPTP
jgi:Flp pilus assembly protein TadG